MFYIPVINWRGHYVIVHQQLELAGVPLLSGAVINQIPLIRVPALPLLVAALYPSTVFRVPFRPWPWDAWKAAPERP